jgi:methylmalonyl-CoA/ethylmalonyl-CoA epimerase
MVKRIAHVGIATRSVSDAARFYNLLGLEVESVETNEEQKVKAAVLKVGESALELLEATEGDSPIARFIDKRGEGIHHITFEVDDIEEELSRLRETNISLIDERPKKGVEGRLVAFVHPSSTGGVLVELAQSVEGVE